MYGYFLGTPPMLNDLAFLMSGGRLRGPGRRDTLMEQLVWMIGGARPGSGAVTAGAPFVFIGAPGDYVFGGEGLDAVVTQLLGQLENAGPPPLPREQIAALPSQQITDEHIAANAACSVCWENFTLGETVSRLECDHIFHSSCIAPWLQLHATCPICRRSLLPEEPADAPAADATAANASETAADASSTLAANASATSTTPAAQTQNAPVTPATISVNTPMLRVPVSFSHVVLRRRLPAGWEADSSGSSGGAGGASGASGASGSPSSASTGSSVTASGVWAPLARDSTSNSTASLSSDRDRQYNMDIDFD
ncbi:E3 ubiquitin-protein ligase Iruka isoform X3 [Manduca sexta]|uniref:E3 ubiquitin-protein ligase Iruka isoform X3 n=1 Tax=Manduca sexta TaxID=7130 RepID=UPI00188EC9E7|nr:E3 ubiquitin-protein ligase Iruka isoform X3 [Manduca sexta]